MWQNAQYLAIVLLTTLTFMSNYTQITIKQCVISYTVENKQTFSILFSHGCPCRKVVATLIRNVATTFLSER